MPPVTHFATPKSDKDVIWIQKKSFLCMGSHFMNPGPSSQKQVWLTGLFISDTSNNSLQQIHT